MRSCVLLYVYIQEGRWIINGSFIDAIEYFLAIFENNKNTDLIFVGKIGSDRNDIINLIRDRYNLEGLTDWEDRVFFKKHYDLMKMKFKRVLIVDYTTIKMTKGLIRSEEIHVIVERYTEKKEYMFSKNTSNVTYWGEMPFEYREKEYRMKFLFDRIKKPEKVEDRVFLTFGPIIDSTGYPEKIKSEKYLKDLGINKEVFLKRTSSTEKFFEKFSTLVYIKTESSNWDTHPRIFVECSFFGKEIIYLNDLGIKDGSYYRYHDVLENGVKGRNLDKNDEIVSIFSKQN